MPYIHIDASDFDTEDLVEELEDRGFTVSNDDDVSGDIKEQLMSIYLQRRLGCSYDHLIDKLIYDVLGKVI